LGVSFTSPVGLSVPYRTPVTPPSQITAVSVMTAANSIQGPSARCRNSTKQPGCPALLGSAPRTVTSGYACPPTTDRLAWLAGAFHSSAQRPSPGWSCRAATKTITRMTPPTSSPNAPRRRTVLVRWGTDMATALDSTATTKRRWLPVDRTVRVSSSRTGRTARPQDLDGGRSQVVVAHPPSPPAARSRSLANPSGPSLRSLVT
jgi:hypothetical protein